MSKKDAFQTMVPGIVKYMNRYASEILKEPTEELEKKAEEIYERMYAETPQIGGSSNPMADNLYEFITFCAYYEASDHRINENCIPYFQEWFLEDRKALSKVFNLNKKSSIWLADRIFSIVARTTKKKKAKGKWGNTWSIEAVSKTRPEGFAYILTGCPLLAFAKAHGYEAILPKFCVIDHASAELMHGKLIRFETEATGGTCCDYWFVGDQSESAKRYASLPKI